MQWLSVALGGALGAMARYGISIAMADIGNSKFPFATMSVNVLGSFAMGVLFVLVVEKHIFPDSMRPLLAVGFLGAFTTFSTFSLDALSLWQNGDLFLALLYVLGTVVLCLIAVSLAVWLTGLVLITV
ncbi:MAG: fluoride efflux transporter CrcB [Porticoccaceae bacterium]|jgi:CrcB protein